MRRINMDKSRGAAKVPRRRASQENQAPTLISVKDCNSECFIDRAEQVDKTNVLGSLLFCSQRQSIFLFTQSSQLLMWSWLHTCRPRATGMCDVTSGSEHMSVLVPSDLHLLIMGPGENYLPSPSHHIFINRT